MDTNLNVAIAPKDSTFQVRINSDIKKAVEDIYAKTGMTLTDAFNTFIQQSLNVEGLPFIVTKNSKEALREQAVAMLMLDLKRSEERAEIEGWIDARNLSAASGVYFIFFNQLPPIPVPNHLHQSNLLFQLVPQISSNQASTWQPLVPSTLLCYS